MNPTSHRLSHDATPGTLGLARQVSQRQAGPQSIRAHVGDMPC